jgi:hypothetical protein
MATEIHYHREGGEMRFRAEGMTNNEVGHVALGIWSMLDAEDRLKLLRMMYAVYRSEGALPAVPLAICEMEHGEGSGLCPRGAARLYEHITPPVKTD